MKISLRKELGFNIKKDDTYVIPIFIPHRGCKNECVFCNQRKISGETRDVTVDDVRQEIKKYIEMYKNKNRKRQIAFFGGSFTGLEKETQIKFLEVANEFIKNGEVENIRVSTRPDYINIEILNILKQYNVQTIELGVQSMNDEVLLASKRGHTAEDVINASKLIKKIGFKLGHQVMVGLPKSTEKIEIETIKKCIKLKPDIVRIYPVYVLKESKLYNMYETKEYRPLSLDDAVKRASKVYSECIRKNINVIRIGLQTTEEINSKNAEIVGPVCDNYKERVLSFISFEKVNNKLKSIKNKKDIVIIANKKEVNYIVGNNKSNLEKYKKENLANITIKVKE